MFHLPSRDEEEDDRGEKGGDFDERDIEAVNLTARRSGSARKRRDSYDYINTVQMLGEQN